jgi:methionyl-tRNA formyltransferase
MRIVFLGTGAFAVPSLRALVAAGHDVALVITQPDRPSGRGRAPAAPPVKEAALELGIELAQPARVREPEPVAAIEKAGADAGVVVAYGQILPRSVFAAPRMGTINVHASLLPRYRGAAPIQWAIASGDDETGVTTMMVAQGLDSGPIVLTASTPIGDRETAGELSVRLARMGAELLIASLSGLADGTVIPRPQDDSLATTAPLIRKEDGRIDWSQPAAQIARRCRAFNPWPATFTPFRGGQLKVLAASEDEPGPGTPGVLTSVGRQGLVVACGKNTRLRLMEVQPESKRPMPAQAFAAGARLATGDALA